MWAAELDEPGDRRGALHERSTDPRRSRANPTWLPGAARSSAEMAAQKSLLIPRRDKAKLDQRPALVVG
jgi:hypothetical protein